MKVKQDFGLAFFCTFCYFSIMKVELKKEFLDKLKKLLNNADYEKYLNAMEDEETHGLVVNLHKLNVSSIDLDYIVNKFNATVVYKNNNFAYLSYDKNQLASNGVFPGKDPLYHVGLYYIQEPSASKVLYDVDVKSDDLVLDLCASPGGKTAELLFSLDKNSGGFLISNEIDFGRTKVLSSNIERLGFENVAVTCSDSQKLASRFTEYFDKILVDAPCSGEGMFRKSEEARLQWNQKLVDSLSNLQKKLVEDAYTMLKNGGTLIYSTCTFSMEEDEEIVEYLLNKHSDFKLCKMEKNYPFNSIGEGQFFAILEKTNGCGEETKHRFDVKDLDGINVLRVGVEAFTVENKVKVPSHASTHCDNMRFDNTLELDDHLVLKYLKGEAIRMDLPFKGYCKVTYKNLGLGLAKYTNGILKNHYPKGLRNN